MNRRSPGICLFAVLTFFLGGSCSRTPPAPRGQNFNLLLVTLDTLRADRLGAYGYPKASTPAFDALARNGILFQRAISPVPLTLPAHSTILSGLPPSRHTIRNNGAGRFPDEVPTLATHLSANGYRTAAFVAAFVLDHRFGLDRGFDLYDDQIDRGPSGEVRMEAERKGGEVVDRALGWLSKGDARPFFAWVHLYDAHAPYLAPEAFSKGREPYDGEVAYVDAQLGRLVSELDRRGLRNNTIIAVVGDHGEGLGEHGEMTHGLLLYDSTLRVPLVISAPGIVASGRSMTTPVSVADLAPTLSTLLGRPQAPAPAAGNGRDLAAEISSGRDPQAQDVFSETKYPELFGWSHLSAVRNGKFKYILSPKPELYDLEKDPGEKVNLLTDERRQTRALSTRLTAFLATDGASSGKPVVMDAETRAKLASLGYLGGVVPVDSKPMSERPDPKAMAPLFQRFEDATAAMIGNRTEFARSELETLLAADSMNPVFRSSLARIHRQMGSLSRAIELYRDAVAAVPDDADAWYNFAVTLHEAGRLEESGVAIREAIRRDPKRPEAHNALGIAYSAGGQMVEAAREFARAAELDPRNAAAWNNLGNVCRELGRLEEAEQAYQNSMKASPEYADPLNGIGALEVQRDHPERALPYFERALQLAPAYHEVHLNKGIALELIGNKQAAIVEYRRFLGAVGDSPAFAPQRTAARQLLARLVQEPRS